MPNFEPAKSIEEERPADERGDAHIQIRTKTVQCCSACGSSEPEHLDYVLRRGLCVT